MINFVYTGLDERIVKSFNPNHPKVIKPILVHRRTGDYIANRPVNVEQAPKVKPHTAKVHELLEDFVFPQVGDLYLPEISAILNTDIFAQNNEKFLDDNAEEEYTIQQLSDKLYAAEKEIAKRVESNRQLLSGDLDFMILKAKFTEGKRTEDVELSQFFNTSVYSTLEHGEPVFYMQDSSPTNATKYTPQELSDLIDHIDYLNSPEHMYEQLDSGIHPLVANSLVYANATELQPQLSHMLGFDMQVYSIFKDDEKQFVIQQKHNPLETEVPITYMTSKELSDVIYIKEQENEQKLQGRQKFSDELNIHRQEELKQSFKQLDPTTVKQFEQLYGSPVFNSGNNYFTGEINVANPVQRPSLFANWADNVLEFNAIESYERYSYEYDWKMNGYMRNKDYEDYPEMLGDIKNIEQTIDQFTLPDNIRVYRILEDKKGCLDEFLKEVLTPAKGSSDSTVIQDLGFASTSVCWKSIEHWGEIHNRIKLVIDVPKGQGRGAYIAPLSKFPKESEFLLQHGTMFKVLNVDKSDLTMYEVHLQVVGCRPELPDHSPSEQLHKALKYSRDKHFVADISDFKIVKL